MTKESAKQALYDFFKANHCQPVVFKNDRVTIRDIIPAHANKLQSSRFIALDDTLLYANLLANFVKQDTDNRIRKLIDLGAGSSLPTIKINLELDKPRKLRVVCVDSDKDAIETSYKNTKACDLSSHCEFVHNDMLLYLKGLTIREGDVVVSNPPYLPVHDNVDKNLFAPVNGGKNGTACIVPVLTQSFPKGTRLVLRWCSLSNPKKIIKLINENYKVLHLEAFIEGFGFYTSQGCMKDYLKGLLDDAMVYYSVEGNNQRKLISIGCVLEKS
ncbi:MAG: methyltransferase [Deltaproteobacteria bacterium]|nr:methyltransferase [Deltaproteobacteria bacterium]